MLRVAHSTQSLTAAGRVSFTTSDKTNFRHKRLQPMEFVPEVYSCQKPLSATLFPSCMYYSNISVSKNS